RRRHTRCLSDWSSDVCSSDLLADHAHGALLPKNGAPVQAHELADAKAARVCQLEERAIPERKRPRSRRLREQALDFLERERPRRSEERRVGKGGREGWARVRP